MPYYNMHKKLLLGFSVYRQTCTMYMCAVHMHAYVCAGLSVAIYMYMCACVYIVLSV